jgi:excinuclease ABC subunit C
MLDLVASNARHAFEQRFRVMKPSAEQTAAAWRDALWALPEPEDGETQRPHRVLRHLAHPGLGRGRFDGGLGRRPDEEVRLPQVHRPKRPKGLGHRGNDDFASMREVVGRRYSRLQRGAEARFRP